MKILKTHLLITLGIYVAIYIITIFSYWEILNPFQWIINLPTYGTPARLAIVIAMVIYNLIVGIISKTINLK